MHLYDIYEMGDIHVANMCIYNKILWLCLVSTATAQFASDAGYRMTKN